VGDYNIVLFMLGVILLLRQWVWAAMIWVEKLCAHHMLKNIHCKDTVHPFVWWYCILMWMLMAHLLHRNIDTDSYDIGT